jgi:hypothetical protein
MLCKCANKKMALSSLLFPTFGVLDEVKREGKGENIPVCFSLDYDNYRIPHERIVLD